MPSEDLILLLLVYGLTFVGSLLITRAIRAYALRAQMVDVPNQRSSHTLPTPRGGGLSFVILFPLTLLFFGWRGYLDWNIVAALTIGGLIVAVAGYLDDRRDLSARVRLLFHASAAVIALLFIGGMPALDLGFTVWEWGLIGHVVGFVGIVWMINLYNFMDGIDGIAASEAISVALLAEILLIVGGVGGGLEWVLLALAAASAGFLVWNWPPAKIFMGDVGSGFLGFVFAVIAIYSAQTERSTLWPWLILLGIFIVDATITVLRRILRRERWYEAHRSHAYQHATTRWNSHLKVTLAVIIVNVIWLGPLALIAVQLPALGVVAAIVALLPLAGLALYLRAGT
ncbi:MAG: glycosyltransferase family 4 protein [Chloroflexi bacterium]|nr:glycosyltransferase family 4 protein [Chloroflexota bacterium]